MEAALPISAGIDAAPPGKRRERVSPERGLQTAPASERRKPALSAAPSVSLPLRFMFTGVAALVVGTAWLIARPSLLASYHYSQYVIAATHLFVLGWIGSVIMGALYQLAPVALETKLYSERLAKWQFAVHVAGFAGMVWMFHAWNLKQVGHFGSVLALGAALFVYNLARTLLRVRHWNVVASAIAAALAWFALTVLAGLSIAAAKCAYESSEGLAAAAGVNGLLAGLRGLAGFVSRFDAISAMHAHAHLGVIGFFVLLIVGVSYRLIPMFTLSELQSRRRAAWSVALLNGGLAGAFVTILIRSPWKLLFALVIVAALAVYGWELRAMLRARKRRALDWGIRTFLAAVALLIPVSVLALVLAWPGLPLNPLTGRLENLYGFLGLLGVVTLAILGMLHKILPFLVWFGVYSPHVGRAQLPTTAQMCSERLQAWGLFSYLAGLLATSAAVMASSEPGVRLGAALLLASLLMFLLNAAKVLTHFFRPQLAPLSTRKRTLP